MHHQPDREEDGSPPYLAETAETHATRQKVGKHQYVGAAVVPDHSNRDVHGVSTGLHYGRERFGRL